jgi:hypothetical protein
VLTDVRVHAEPRRARDGGPIFMLGLPYLSDGALLAAVRDLGAPVLFSANAFSVWSRAGGRRAWRRFRTNHLALLDGLDVVLDSAGFVAARCYGSYPWTVDDYLDFAAAYPFRWFAAMDFCVEPEIARDRAAIAGRIKATVSSLARCLEGAEARGVRARLMPVVQGRTPDDYTGCLEAVQSVAGRTALLGVGSVCRRPATGPDGVLAIVDRLDRELGADAARLHLFGVKSTTAAALAHHPRIASFDSQAYGVQARRLAHSLGCSKTNDLLVSVMTAWYHAQRLAIQQQGRAPAVWAIATAAGTATQSRPFWRATTLGRIGPNRTEAAAAHV